MTSYISSASRHPWTDDIKEVPVSPKTMSNSWFAKPVTIENRQGMKTIEKLANLCNTLCHN